MENKEMKKPIPAELNDDALDNVSGGTTNGCGLEVLIPSDSFLPDDALIEPLPEMRPPSIP